MLRILFLPYFSFLIKFKNCFKIKYIYIHYPDNMGEYVRQLQRFNVGEDCPVFDGLFEYCQIYTSGSIGNSHIHMTTYILINVFFAMY